MGFMRKSMRGVMSGLLPVFLLMGAAQAQRPYYNLPGLHPGFSLVSMRPSSLPASGNNAAPNTGGMAWLPDGRLFIASMASSASGGPTGHLLTASTGFIFSGIVGATSNASVTAVEVGSGFRMPSGAIALGDTLYVVDNYAGLIRLTPGAGGTYTQSSVYAGRISDSATNKGTMPANTWGHRTWNGGLLYKDGFFYVPVGNGLISGDGTTYFVDANMYRGKGVVYKIPKNGGPVDTLAGGVRNPVSLAWGPDSAMLYTDNQGSFMPSSALFHVKPGRFFGHPKTPYDNVLRTPPAVIFNYGAGSTGGTATNPSVTKVATDMLTLRNGMYRNQLLVGSNHTTGMNRVFLEKVGGELQGAVFPFSQGFGLGTGNGAPTASAPGVLADFRSSVNRLSYGPDGHIYVGGGNSPGNSSSGSHGFDGGLQYGLARLVPNNDTVFEMKAIRSLGPTTMEVEFTEPITAAAVSNFSVRQWGYLQGGTANSQSYGAGNHISGSGASNNVALTVSAVTLNTAKTRATLTIPAGLEQRATTATPGDTNDRKWGNVVQIIVTGVTAVSNRPMWQDTLSSRRGLVGWYTLNKFGPGEDVGQSTAIARGASNDVRTGLMFKVRNDGILVRSPVEGAYTLTLLDMRGRVMAAHEVAAGRYEFLVPASSLATGVTVLDARAADGRRFTATVSRLQ
jgi:glucose/arabinose dehydrogenase